MASVDFGPVIRRAVEGLGPQFAVFGEILEERARQDEKWGEQNHPDLSPFAQKPWVGGPATHFYGLPPVELAKQLTDADASQGSCSWARIALEELTEVIDAADQGDQEAVRTEVVQLAAVCVQWIAAIDRRDREARDGDPS